METWFISDLHLGHKNILEFEKEHRPFATLEEMHNAFVERWNAVVNDNDTVYVIGDVAFGKGYLPILERFRGKKRLVLGNHDTYPIAAYVPYFKYIYGAKFWEDCILTHIPVHPRSLASRCLLNVHGHLHSRNMDDPCYFNVSAEQNNLTPINADIIRDHIERNL